MKTANDMMRAIGLNVPREANPYVFVTDNEEFNYDTDERAIMSKAGWDCDTTPVDRFMCSPVSLRLDYAQGMRRLQGDD